MKLTRKFMAILMVFAMILSMGVLGAFAEAEKETATVDNKTKHSYDAYQIFSGTQADGNPALGDVEWGTGINGTAFLNALQGDARFEKDGGNIFAACETAAAVEAVLAANAGVVDAFANVAAANLATKATPIDSGAESVALDLGYYLLVDTTDVSGKNDARNSALLQVTNSGDVQIREKYNVPKPDKQITGVNTLVGTDFEATDAVDVEIGDIVQFTLTGTLPSNYADYEKYVYKFHDTLSTGLEYQGSAQVYVVNGTTETEVTGTFNVSETGCGNDDCRCNLMISCDDLKTITDVTIDKDSVIKVVYSAKLTTGATLGSTGNPNEMYVEYSNNPNQDSDGIPDTGKTPKDKVLVFTYELDVTKVDGNTTTELSEAQFVLLNSEKDMVATVDANGKLTGWEAIPKAANDGTITWPEGSVLTSDSKGLFNVTGLDSATYYLREIKAPAGYNLLTKDVAVVITAIVNGDEGSEELTALEIKVDTEVGTSDESTGVVSATIKNYQGGTLPETGAMGTVIFVAVGSLVAVAAVCFLVTKKRMQNRGMN